MEKCVLPREVLLDIFARLPVKSLMRFKSVCKFFCDFIKFDQYFMHKHYEFSSTKNDCAVIECFRNRSPLEFSLIYRELFECDEIQCVYLDIPNSKSKYVKCCRGLLSLIVGDFTGLELGRCYREYVFDVFVLNPSIREIKVLPSIRVPYKPIVERCRLICPEVGFGFGVSNDTMMNWKVVMLWYCKYVLEHRTETDETVMVCSRVGDSWSWRQISAVPNVPVECNHDFFLKGRYYWRVAQTHNLAQLLWFDIGDEFFGMIELPFKDGKDIISVMNDKLALIRYPDIENENHVEIWLMDENNNNNSINWHKQTSIGTQNEQDWIPIGIWNLDSHLLVFPYVQPNYTGDGPEEEDEDFIPYMISVHLVTQEKSIIYLTPDRETTNIVSNSSGYVQVYGEENINVVTEEQRKNFRYYPSVDAYARIYSESLYLL